MATEHLPKIYSRKELIAICERAVVLESKWHNRDSASSQIKVGQAWALLKAECTFRQLNGSGIGALKTDKDTIWIEIDYRGFQAFEWGDEAIEDETFYLPTPKRLDESAGKDWY